MSEEIFYLRGWPWAVLLVKRTSCVNVPTSVERSNWNQYISPGLRTAPVQRVILVSLHSSSGIDPAACTMFNFTRIDTEVNKLIFSWRSNASSGFNMDVGWQNNCCFQNINWWITVYIQCSLVERAVLPNWKGENYVVETAKYLLVIFWNENDLMFPSR